jgi:hypothetical protein
MAGDGRADNNGGSNKRSEKERQTLKPNEGANGRSEHTDADDRGRAGNHVVRMFSACNLKWKMCVSEF